MPTGDEVAESRLIQRRGMNAHRGAQGDDRIDQRWRDDEIAEPERREEQLVEAAGEDHAIVGVETLEGRQRLAAISILAVVIIFDDERRRRAGPLEETEPPLVGQR